MENKLRSSGKHSIRLLGRTWTSAYSAPNRLNRQGFIANTQLNRDRATLRCLVNEVEFQRQREPMDVKRILAARLGQQRSAPTCQLSHDRFKLFATAGEMKQSSGNGRRRVLMVDNACLLKLA